MGIKIGSFRFVTRAFESNAAEQAYLATNDSDEFIIIRRSRLVHQALKWVNSQLQLILFHVKRFYFLHQSLTI